MNIINLFSNEGYIDAQYGEFYHGKEKEVASIFGAKNIGFHLEILNPKTFTCPYHYHTEEEEICLVIEGEAILRVNNEFRKVKAGDLIYHGTNEKSAHHMYNHTEKPFKFLAMSTKFPEEKCFYPDSRKIMDRKLKTITQDGQPAAYFKDEETPAQYWPEEALLGRVPEGTKA